MSVTQDLRGPRERETLRNIRHPKWDLQRGVKGEGGSLPGHSRLLFQVGHLKLLGQFRTEPRLALPAAWLRVPLSRQHG